MQKRKYSTYEEATKDYLALFRVLRNIPQAKSGETTRGSIEIPVDILIEQAAGIANVSSVMIPLAKSYLEAPDPSLREGISGQLLAQAATELMVVTELLQIASGEQDGQSVSAKRVPRGSIRASHSASLREAIGSMEVLMATPVTGGLLTPKIIRRSVVSADTPDEAKMALQQIASVTATAISRRVVEIGGNIASKLVFETEWSAVIEGTGIMNSKAAELLDSIKDGVGELFTKAVKVAAKTLQNVYNKLLALLGKDYENEASRKINVWLDKIKSDGKIEVFDYLISKLYRIDEFRKDLSDWLENTTAEVVKINSATKTVEDLSRKFIVLVGRINTISDITGVARTINIPQVQLVIAGIRVALLATLVYLGYDYLGYKQIRFPNLTMGVAEVIKVNLLPVV